MENTNSNGHPLSDLRTLSSDELFEIADEYLGSLDDEDGKTREVSRVSSTKERVLIGYFVVETKRRKTAHLTAARVAEFIGK